jgi:hypothetical protein
MAYAVVREAHVTEVKQTHDKGKSTRKLIDTCKGLVRHPPVPIPLLSNLACVARDQFLGLNSLIRDRNVACLPGC